MWARRLSHPDRRLPIDHAGHILVVRPDGIGDVVLTGPFLRELRRNHPHALITLVVNPDAFNLVEICPYVDRVLTLRLAPTTRWWHPLSRRATTLLFAWRYLRPARHDLAIAPRWGADLYEASSLIYFSGAPYRAGYSERSSETYAGRATGYDHFFTSVVDDRSVKHEVQRNLDLLSSLGMRSEDIGLELWLSDEDQGVANEIIAPGGSVPLVALGLGAGSPRRIWPLEGFAQVGQWLMERGAGLVLVGGPDDERLAKDFQRRLGGSVIDVTNKVTLRQTVALLGRCSLFCGNDAGPMHLAAAAGVPVVEVSCHSRQGDDLHPNSPKRFGPWGVPHRIARPQAPADGCVAGCRMESPHCILRVNADAVIAAIESLRKEISVSRGAIDAS
jgi:heptosyltransferase-2